MCALSLARTVVITTGTRTHAWKRTQSCQRNSPKAARLALSSPAQYSVQVTLHHGVCTHAGDAQGLFASCTLSVAKGVSNWVGPSHPDYAKCQTPWREPGAKKILSSFWFATLSVRAHDRTI